MTYEESLMHARKELEVYRRKVNDGYTYYEKIFSFYENVVSALEKQIQKKLNKTKNHLYPLSCPNCDCGFMDDVDYDCCPSCGQAFLWRDAE